MVSLIDGRRDVGSVMRDCGLNRFRAATILRELVDKALVAMRPAAIEGLGDNAVAVVIRSPIDFYTQVFLATLREDKLSHHLLTVALDEDEEHVVEVPMMAVTLADEEEEEDKTLVFALGNGSSEPAWQQLAGRCAAGILLVNANSFDSVRASIPDLRAMQAAADLPVVIATYVSIAEEQTPPSIVALALDVGDTMPVLECDLRDREAVNRVVATALSLSAAPAA